MDIRRLADFFGEEHAERFWDALAVWGIYAGGNDADINLAEYNRDLPSFARALVQAFEILLASDNVSRYRNKPDEFADELRRWFLDSPHRDVHAALFGLSQLFPYVWVKGRRNYGVRIALENCGSSGVSLFRSKGPGHIVVNHSALLNNRAQC